MTVQTPIETRSSNLPRWAILLTLILFLVGGAYLAGNLVGENPPLAVPGASAGPVDGGSPDPAVGEALIAQATPQCTSCHGADLGGSGTFPSLHGVATGPVSENLQDLAAEHPDDWAQIWIAGDPGGPAADIDRLGMPAFHDQFTPEQLDSIVAYLETLP